MEISDVVNDENFVKIKFPFHLCALKLFGTIIGIAFTTKKLTGHYDNFWLDILIGGRQRENKYPGYIWTKSKHAMIFESINHILLECGHLDDKREAKSGTVFSWDGTVRLPRM